MEKRCINCEGFAWWDGDYCCVKKFKLFCESKDGTYSDELVEAINKEKDCDEYNYVDSPVAKMYEEEYEKFLKDKK